VDTITYRTLVQRALPIILANTAVPILGLVDTAIIGNVGNTEDLGAIALGALVYSFLFWSFGFLRMATTGFVAQAAGAGREDEIQAIVLRALLLALVLGIVLVLMQVPMAELVFHLFSASAGVENTARDYFLLRVWSAPSTFATFALFGTLIGLGKSRVLLGMQLFLNGTNALLDIIFAGVLGWGVTGIAVGTLLAEWSTFLLGAFVVFNILRARNGGQIAKVGLAVVLEHKAILQTFIVIRDIFLRTLALVFAFAWFNNQSAMLGDVVLAANHILVQFIGFSAFFLDGYAMVAEAVVGSALGARRLADFDCAVRRTTVLAAGTAALLAILLWLGGSFFIAALTNIEEVRGLAVQYLGMAALYILLSAYAFQLDGIFIGALCSRQMRDAQLLSVAGYLLAWGLLTPVYGNTGLWLAFIIYVLLRAVTLLLYYPALRRTLLA